ncbi:Ragulator complex protein lamtor2 [Phytophthora pseudosyringae]|uniref:Ragulator complex protein lamtor2 n=1 Tax=Phytophthora pseudosyringae TaxID=221518 RepID=A0A8T1WCQ8_9STRA|nr:Ragulator complex protein lamtor2 [Phytophthora pseudosyringae]
MLRAKVLPEVLGQIVGDGITACMLMTLEGALVGSVGDGDAGDHKVVGAIASHTWGEYLHAGKEANPTGDLRTMLRGRLAMTVAGKTFLLCAYSSTDAPAGLLKAKVETLGAYLSASLDQIEM